MEGTKYLKLFDTEANYNAYLQGDIDLPNVCLVEEDYDVKYNPDSDYCEKPFTIEIIDSGTFTWGGGTYRNIQYSKNGNAYSGIPNEGFEVESGDKISFKTNADISLIYDDYHSTIAINNNGNVCKYNVYGNIASLLFVNYVSATTLSNDSIITQNGPFVKLFKDSGVVDASNLIIPFTNTGHYTYCFTFDGCRSLVSAPSELPATNFISYKDGGCYEFMFRDCVSLVNIPSILPCTNLQMKQCYYGMFQGCTSITTAPELPALTLTQYAYCNMFNGCTSLNYIKCLATNRSATQCTNNWVSNVAANGTFVKNSSMASWPNGASGIPNGWTVENE